MLQFKIKWKHSHRYWVFISSNDVTPTIMLWHWQ